VRASLRAELFSAFSGLLSTASSAFAFLRVVLALLSPFLSSTDWLARGMIEFLSQ
jgi:hypothetical protein